MFQSSMSNRYSVVSDEQEMVFKSFSFLHSENEEQVGLSDLIGSLSSTDENRILKKKLVSKYRSIKYMLVQG